MTSEIDSFKKWVLDEQLTSLSRAQLAQKAGKSGKFTLDQVNAYWTRNRGHDEADVDEIHGERRKQKREFVITSDPFCLQMDVFFMPRELASKNDRFWRLLVAVDILSRYAFAFPIMGETSRDIVDACEKLVKAARDIKGITADDQFNTAAFKAFWGELNVPTYTVIAADDHKTQSTNRLGIVDSFCKMLRRHLTMYQDQNNTDRWLDGLEISVKNHNELETKELDWRSPDEIYHESDELTLAIKAEGERMRNANVAERVNVESPLKVGDLVRVRWAKTKFEKEGDTWSREVYKIVEKLPFKFKISLVSSGVVQRKRFSAQHLLKVRTDSKDVAERPNETQRAAQRGKRRLAREGLN
jgi:hypothetical protein